MVGQLQDGPLGGPTDLSPESHQPPLRPPKQHAFQTGLAVSRGLLSDRRKLIFFLPATQRQIRLSGGTSGAKWRGSRIEGVPLLTRAGPLAGTPAPRPTRGHT